MKMLKGILATILFHIAYRPWQLLAQVGNPDVDNTAANDSSYMEVEIFTQPIKESSGSNNTTIIIIVVAVVVVVALAAYFLMKKKK